MGPIHLPVTPLKAKICLFIVAFAILGALILSKPAWRLQDFDQHFYITIAYDLDSYGVFSNGEHDAGDPATTRPPSGMFFGPVYPVLVFVLMKLDPRFAEAVRCSVEAHRGYRNEDTCEAYDASARLLNAFLLAIGVVAVASAAQLIFRKSSAIVTSGYACGGRARVRTFIFSPVIIIEAAIFAIYGVFALVNGRARKT